MSTTKPSNKLRVYICGPISGIENGNKKAFDLMEAQLWTRGFHPINPHVTCAHIKREFYQSDKAHWQACMRADIRELMTADAIVLLPGWQNSKGAHVEITLAKELGIRQISFQSGNSAAEHQK